MADSLVLKGVKDVRKHTGSEMLLMRPKRGGDTHQIKRWWTPGTKSTVYVACSLFKVTQGTAVVYLAIDTNEMSAIRVDLDTNFEFKFFGIAQIERAALFDEQMNLIEHYLFPKISGGKNVTVTPPGGASRPGASAPPTTIDSVTVSGPTSPTSDTSVGYTASITGTAINLSYNWSVTGNGTIQGSNTSPDVQVEFTPGAATVNCEISDPGASDSPQSGNIAVNVSAPLTTIGSVTVSGPTSPTSGVSVGYTASITGTANNLSYNWSVTGNGTIQGSSTSPNVQVEFTSGAATVACEISDPGASDTPQSGNIEVTAADADLNVVVTVANGVYELDGIAQDTVNLTAGQTVAFDLSDSSLSGHPFAIYTDSSKTTVVSVGVETSNDGSLLTFTPPIPGTFSYQCTQHVAMGGDIIVS